MRIVAIFEVFRIVWTKARKPSKKKVRLQKDRECFKGMAEELKELKKDG
jgi:hypothetical protein